mmetsp:Transcript_74088/g.176470  ORF Transcript_74088/g.176470 Transcript_74088/m.176470 type:complete len:199 (+) Transcript_74088:100-696(+)
MRSCKCDQSLAHSAVCLVLYTLFLSELPSAKGYRTPVSARQNFAALSESGLSDGTVTTEQKQVGNASAGEAGNVERPDPRFQEPAAELEKAQARVRMTECVADGQPCPAESLLQRSACCGTCDEDSKTCVKCLPKGRSCSRFGQCCESCLVHREGVGQWTGVCTDATTVVDTTPGLKHRGSVGETAGQLIEVSWTPGA